MLGSMVAFSAGCGAQREMLRFLTDFFPAALETLDVLIGPRIEQAVGRLPLGPFPFEAAWGMDTSDAKWFRSALDLTFLT